jgi:hypothetical protein
LTIFIVPQAVWQDPNVLEKPAGRFTPILLSWENDDIRQVPFSVRINLAMYNTNVEIFTNRVGENV